jgi:nucleoside-diphosphate-sugar epimerase
MNIVITGANGFIGSHLVKKFLDAGDTVYAIVKDHNEDVSHISECRNIIYCSLDNLDSVYDELKDVESPVFYHLAWAGVNGSSKADYTTQIMNVKMTLDVASFAKKLNARCFLCAGTIAEKAVDSFQSLEKIAGGQMYGVGKVATRYFLEAYCKNAGLPFVWMRFSNIYGPDNKTGNLISYTLTQLQKNEEASFGPALQPYDFIYVNDLIEAVFLLGRKEDHAKNDYFIGSGSPRILKDYLEEVGRLYGKPELIRTGLRADDGIKYTMDMFDTSDTVAEVGEYISKNFTDGIKYTIERF